MRQAELTSDLGSLYGVHLIIGMAPEPIWRGLETEIRQVDLSPLDEGLG
jgi:hypothetical protein